MLEIYLIIKNELLNEAKERRVKKIEINENIMTADRLDIEENNDDMYYPNDQDLELYEKWANNVQNISYQESHGTTYYCTECEYYINVKLYINHI